MLCWCVWAASGSGSGVSTQFSFIPWQNIWITTSICSGKPNWLFLCMVFWASLRDDAKGKGTQHQTGESFICFLICLDGPWTVNSVSIQAFQWGSFCEEWSSLYFLEQLFQAPLLLQAHTAALKNLSLGFLHSCDSQRHLKIQSWDSCKQLWLPSLLSPHLSLLFPWEKKVVFNSFLWDREGVNFKLLFVLFYFIFWGGGQCKGCFKAQSEGNQGTSGRTIYKYTANTTR